MIGVSAANAAPPPAAFQPRISRPVQGPALWTATADFNGDNRIDVAVGSNGSTHITTFHQQANGTLPATGVITPTAGVPTRLSTGDFNADGRADLIYLDDNSGLKLTYGQANNTFGNTTPIPFGHDASFWGRTSVGDLNQDGRLDAMISYARSTGGTGRVVTAFALPAGGFNVTGFNTNSDPHGIANADLNGDTFPDIMVGDNGGGAPIKVGYGSPSGAFTVQSFPYGDRGYGVVARDFNGDGRADVAAAAWNQGAFGVMLTQPNGALGLPTFFTATSTAYDIAAGDVNGDHVVDLVVSAQNHSGLTVHVGNGNGTFAAPLFLSASASGTSTVSVADLDGNGYDDIVVAAASGQNLDIFYAVPEPGTATVLCIAAITLVTRRRRR